MKKLQEYVGDINENISKLEARGPVSKYVLSDENLRGRWDLSISPSKFNHFIFSFDLLIRPFFSS